MVFFGEAFRAHFLFRPRRLGRLSSNGKSYWWFASGRSVPAETLRFGLTEVDA